MQYIMQMCLLLTGACALVFGIGAYLFLIAISKCLKVSLFGINVVVVVVVFLLYIVCTRICVYK